MANDFDIFNPKISQVVKGSEGKMILIHSDERKLGKTYVGCHMPKPYYLRFEQGINAISGVPYADLTSWSDFKKVNRKLTDPKTLDKAKDLYSTIIFDTIDVAIKWCESYVCATQGVSRLNDGNNGYGLWKEYENEWFKEINKLTNAGYSLYFIAHSEIRKKTNPTTNEEYEQMCPKGDKRTTDIVLDLVDFIGYVKSNGFDEDGNEIPSSVYFANTQEFQAGSRFTHMTKKIDVFSAENLQKAIIDAIEAEEKESGIKGITLEEQKEMEKANKKEWTHEEIVAEINKYGKALFKQYKEQCTDILEEYLGVDVKVSDTTKKQLPQLEMVLFDLQELADSEGISI